MSPWPENVGILAIELIFPSQYVDQNDLEIYDGVSSGKYTIGLGQNRMGFCSDREDINSLCLTVVKNLLERNQIELNRIGRIDVGTETIIDKSKSVKSVLMQLFEPYGLTDLEGIDTTNACYGGTAALFNAINWIESSSWDGRLAITVCGDIAVYGKGSARPTGGAGAVAMLIGPNAPLVFDRGLRATYMKHAYDFYKPDLTSEYPIVDGKLSIQCYLSALDHCYQLYCDKYKKLYPDMKGINIKKFDAILFHTPFCKLVQKSLARIGLNDFVRSQQQIIITNNNNNNNNNNFIENNGTKIIENNNNNNNNINNYPIEFDKYNNIKLEDTYFDRDIEKTFMTHYNKEFEQKTKKSLLIANQVGNMYTPSVYSGLVSFLINSGSGGKIDDNDNINNNNNDENIKVLLGKNIALFSYGSGLASSMYSITITNDFIKLKNLIEKLLPLKSLLNQRQKVTPEEFTKIMEIREQNNHKVPNIPSGNIDVLFPGTYYLESIDDMHRRIYKRVPPTIPQQQSTKT